MTPAGRGALAARRFDLLPTGQAREILTTESPMSAGEADKAITARPVVDPGRLPDAVRTDLVR